MQFLQAVSWLSKFFPRLAEAVDPLRVLLDEQIGGINAGPSELRRIGQSCRKHGSVRLRKAMHKTWWPTPSLCHNRRKGMYVCMVTHIARVWINRVRLPILHVVS